MIGVSFQDILLVRHSRGSTRVTHQRDPAKNEHAKSRKKNASASVPAEISALEANFGSILAANDKMGTKPLGSESY
jgi:hypothetical protein